MRDVVGCPLEEARARLKGEGWRVEVRQTAPPRAGRGTGSQRVIRQRLRDGVVELVVSWEWYERLPPEGR
ncbi:MAG: PASTA domain-containing protein [Armatimonadota bacterium]|nr:PASTA domain-containing protein [Armatimonadota bacterium]